MAEVPRIVVEAAWKEAARLDLPELKAGAAALEQGQPELVAFASACLKALRPQARELGLYLLFVVFRMFENGRNGALERVSARQVSKAQRDNEAMLQKLDGVHDRFVKRIATARQPHVMLYVVDALSEFGTAPGDTVLSEDEIATLFLVLKSAVDALDGAAREGRE